MYSIIDDGYKSIDSMINENKKELDAKNNQIGANLDALDDKIENFASRLLKSVQADSDDLITKNTTFESIMKEFKDSIRQEFDMFEQIGKVNIEKTISSLDELQKLNSKNRQIQEQTLMSQVLQIKESSKNITRMIESIKIDFQKAHVSKCKYKLKNELIVNKKISS